MDHAAELARRCEASLTLVHVVVVVAYPRLAGQLPSSTKLPDAEHADGSVSLYPSIWRRAGCRAHFFVKRSTIVWC